MTAVEQQQAPAAPWITEPGIYELTAEQYHADPVVGGSLSSSGAKKLAPPSCPAIFKHWLDNGQDHKRAFDFGRAAHTRVLGVGDDVVVIDAPNYNRKAAQEQRDEVYAAGRTPLLAHEDEQVEAMADALRRHPMAAALLDPDTGRAEQTLVWRDEMTGVMCRALLDFLRHPVTGQRMVVPDYKTAAEVDPDSISRALWSYAYYGQAAWYTDGVQALVPAAGDPAFVLIFQRKTAPHLVHCAQVYPDAVHWGHLRNQRARDLYRQCVRDDSWPGYADDTVTTAHLPTYATYQLEGAHRLGLFELEGRSL